MSFPGFFNKWRGGPAPGPDRETPPGGPLGDDENGAQKLLWRAVRRRLLLVLALALGALLYSQCVVITMPDEYVVIQQFGEIKSVTDRPGISLKLPFIQIARSVPNNVRLYDIPISDVITQDKKTMVADSFVLWRVSNPTDFIRTLSGNIGSAESRIGNISYNSMKTVISGLPQTEIISGRDTLADKISQTIGGTLDQYGVQLIGIETKHLDLPDDNKQAVYTRMISERNNIAAAYQAEGGEEARKIRTDTDTTVSIMLSKAQALAAESIAEGESMYMQTLAEAYNSPEKAEYYAFVRSLEAAETALASGKKMLVLSPDSPLAQIFYSLS